MIEPRFDKSTGYWSVRYHISPTKRVKKNLGKHPGWKPGDKVPKSPPAEIKLEARQYQDIDESAKAGQHAEMSRDETIENFLARYARSYAIHQKPNSHRALMRAIDRFMEFCKDQKHSRVLAVTLPVCRTYLETRATAGAAYATMENERALLGAAWARSIDDGEIKVNPWTKAKIPGSDHSEGTPSWSGDEVEAILSVLEGDTRDIFVVGINCGFRCDAIRHMRWGWIDWSPKRRSRGTLTCPREWSKSGKEYSVPLSDELHDVLARRLNTAKDTSRTAPVFPGRAAGGIINASGFAQRMERACKKAGVEWRGHPWHAMRSTFATRCVDRGVNPLAIQEWMNHSSLKMTDKYLKWSDKASDSEMDRMEARIKQEGTGTPPAGP